MENIIPELESNIQEYLANVKTIKLTHGHIAIHRWTAAEAVAASADGVHAAITMLATTQTITTGITNPVTPRNISITGAKAGETPTGDVVITGTDIFDQVITDTIALDGDNTVQGVKAFKTVTSIAIPVRVTEADTVSIGWGDLLGLSMFLANKDQLIQCSLDGVIEATRATVTVSDTVISQNTIDLNSALNGKAVNAYVIVC